MRVWSGQREFGVEKAGVVVVTDAADFRGLDLHESILGASMHVRGERYTVGPAESSTRDFLSFLSPGAGH
jgi:hypothetical protein